MKKVFFKALLLSIVFGLSSAFFHFIALKIKKKPRYRVVSIGAEEIKPNSFRLVRKGSGNKGSK